MSLFFSKTSQGSFSLVHIQASWPKAKMSTPCLEQGYSCHLEARFFLSSSAVGLGYDMNMRQYIQTPVGGMRGKL